MKISELVALLEKRKEEFGDVDVRMWDDDNCYMSLNIPVNDFLRDSDGRLQGRVDHYVGIVIKEDEE